MFWDKYPYTDLHELNLDWVLSVVKKMETALDGGLAAYIRDHIDELFIESSYDEEHERLIIVLKDPDGNEITTVTVSDDEISQIQLGDTVYPVKDAAARDMTDTDLNVHITPALWTHHSPGSGRQAQGLTSDGTYLYMATVSNSDGISDPKMERIALADKSSQGAQYITRKGHYNNINYYDGDIYCTGIGASDQPDSYDQVYIYDYSTNTGTAVTTNEEYWNFAKGISQYGTEFYVGFLNSMPTLVLWNEVEIGSGHFYPFTSAPIEWVNGVEQGCCLYENKYIISIVSDRRTWSTGHSNDEIRITTLTGQIVKRIMLEGIIGELEDVCMVGNQLFCNTHGGRIYTITDITVLFRGYREATRPNNWPNPCYLYINENDTETNYTSGTGYVLKTFLLSTFTMRMHFGYAVGYLNVNSNLFPFRVNPSTGDISVNAIYGSGSALYDLRFVYKRSSTSTHYKYTLSEIKGGYWDANGWNTISATTDAAIQTVVDNLFASGGKVYIHDITALSSVPYTYSPESF